MGAFANYFETAQPSAQPDVPPEEPTIGSEISRGFSSGLRSAGANLNQLAGLGGEVVGANDFAKGRYAAAKGLRTQAEEMAPVTNTWDQVHDLRSGAHFVAGQLGATAPVAGAAVAGGLATGSPFTAGAIAMGLPAAGDIATRQQEDVQASRESPGTRLTKAVAGGLVSGGVQSIGPGMFAGKVLGKGAAAAAGPGIGSLVAKNMAEGIGVNAAGGAAGEAISQYATNQDKSLDYAPIKDAAITGAVVGSAFGAGGAGVDVIRSRSGSVRTSINDRIEASKKALGDAADSAADSTAGKKFTSVAEDVNSLFQRGTKAASDAVDRVMQGRHEGDDATMAAATPEQAADMLKGSDAAQTKQSASWGEQMMNSAGITPEQHQKVSDAMGNISEPAGRAAMAGLKKVWDLGETAVSKASALRESFKRTDADVGDAASASSPIKQSADYSGANKAIADKLGPLLANSQPELVNKPGAMADVADSLRQAVTQMPNKHLSADTVFRLIDSLGSDTAATLEGAYQAVGNKDPAKAESFYASLNQIADQQSRTSTLRGLVGGSLTEKSQRLIRSSDLGELTQALIGYARGDMDNPNAGPQERASRERQLQALMTEHFGDKADAVTKAIKKEADARTKEEVRVEPGSETDSQQGARGEDGGIITSDKYGAYDESGGRLDAQDMETISKGRGPNNDPVMDPALFASSREPGQNYAAQYIKDMQAKYPDHDVRFVKDEGSQTHGHVIAERAADPEKLSAADLSSMKLDKKYASSKDRINVGDEMLDTKRIAKVMDRRLEYTPGDEQSRAHRMSRMFHEGIARLTEMHGKFDVPDSAVIGKIGGKDFTFGDSKKLSRATEADSASDANAQKISELRKQYAQATWSPEKLAKAGLKEVKLSGKDMAALQQEAREYGSLTEFAKNRELTSGDGAGSGAHFNKDGDLTREGSTGLQDRDGRTATGKDEQIHQAASALGEGDGILHKSNMDGSAHSVSDRASSVAEGKNTTNDLVMAARDWRTSDTAAGRAIGERATVLLKNLQRMSETDQRKFVGVAGGSAADASSVVNALAQKYKSGIVAPGAKSESIKAVAGTMQEPNPVKLKDGKVGSAPDAPKSIAEEADKQGASGILEKAIGKRQEYLNNPPDNYSTEVAKGHLDWAARQKERVDAEYEKAKTGDDVERQGQLSDLRGSLGRLITKAKAVLEGDASLKDFEGSAPSPKEVAAKKAALLERAASGDKDLVKELSTSSDAKGLQRAVGLLAEKAPGSKALEAANERLSQLVQDPDVAYGLLTKKLSAESTSPGTSNAPGSRPDVAEHITKVLGDSVKLKWADLTHAGEFERMRLHDVIRLSVHALDPMSTAYHESLHAVFAQLKDAKATDISDVLAKAAASEHVMAQLTERFRNEPEVLKQLKNPEERAAYMYQMWAADPSFKVSIATKGVFGKIADFIRSTLGIWSNDERALHIMQYFNEGKYAQDMKNPSVVRDAVMAPGRNQVLEAAHSFVKPLAGFADSIVGSGSSRLRDTGVKALGELADLIKREHTTEGGDQGYIQAARLAMTKRMGDLGDSLNGYTPEQLQSAMEQLQSGKKADTPEARIAARTIQKTLADTKAYMEKSGLEVRDLGPDYFPRVWDNHYISKNLPAFRDMLEPYVRRGEFKGSIDQFIQNLGSREGNEFGIEKAQPGMQFTKSRLLSFIRPEDASQFLKKDLFGTMSSYVGQATRLAEWNRRLGGGKLEELMSRAKDEGATPEQLGMVDNYLKGVNGTLGDNLNPHIRRLMGNMIVYQNVRLLPMAAFSMLIDPSGVMVRGGTVKDAWSTFKRGMSELPQTFGKDAKPDEATRLAELTGVIDSAMLTHTMGDLYTQGMVGGVAKSINNTFFKYNMVEGLNRSFRVGASEAAMSFMARHADGTNSTHSERFMNELGVQKGDIIVTKDGRIALTAADGLKPEQVERVHAAVNQWVDGAILRPDAADKPIWMNDPRFALVSHLKQFVYSFQKTILDRTMHEMKHGNYTPAMALASYVPVMMAADFLKGALVSGGGQPEWQKGWDIADYVGYGVQRAGLAGVGQFGLDIAKDIHRGGIGIGALTGPTIEQFGDAVQLLGGHKQFGPMVLNAMPANALYAHAFGGGNVPDPMFAE